MTHAIANVGEAKDFVDRHPMRDPVAEFTHDEAGIVSKILCHLAIAPRAIEIFKCLRTIPMK